MSLAEKTFENADGPELTDVALRLEADAHALLVELMQRTACDASELVGWALGAYWRELEGIVLPALSKDDVEAALARSETDSDFRRHFTAEQIASIERGLADAKAGRTISNADMFAGLRAKFGW